MPMTDLPHPPPACYLTADGTLIAVQRAGTKGDGREQWHALVEGMGGIARWAVDDLLVPPGWSTERVARHALDWACHLPDGPGCQCGRPDCPLPGERVVARDVFGPSDPATVQMQGPWLDRKQAIVQAMVQSGQLDEGDAEEAYEPPSVADLLAELDGTDPPDDDDNNEPPPDPYKGSTWRLG